ncbi:MAG: hypothetical protein Q4C47_03160, partial [Planctomycetia bacterium]|nr:hypothetical protein [Planctomycetia bacterium]
GLQTVHPEAQRLIGRRVDLTALEAGCRSLQEAGISVRMDLIIGLPGDTPESVRRGFDWLESHRDLWTYIQIFHLSVLPGTLLRRDAKRLGLRYQSRPPYTILSTPSMDTIELIELMREAQERFGIEYDRPPDPVLPGSGESVNPSAIVYDTATDVDALAKELRRYRRNSGKDRSEKQNHTDIQIHIDEQNISEEQSFMESQNSSGESEIVRAHLPPADQRGSIFSLVVKSRNFAASGVSEGIRYTLKQILADAPYSPLDVFLVPRSHYRSLTSELLESIRALFYANPGYAERSEAMSASAGTDEAPMVASKRLIVVLPVSQRNRLGQKWIDRIGERAVILWTGTLRDGRTLPPESLTATEIVQPT